MYPIQVSNDKHVSDLGLLFSKDPSANTPNCKSFIPLPDFAHIGDLYENGILTIVDIEKLHDFVKLSHDEEIKYEYNLLDQEKKDLYAMTNGYRTKAVPILDNIENSIKYAQQPYEQLLNNNTFSTGIAVCSPDAPLPILAICICRIIFYANARVV